MGKRHTQKIESRTSRALKRIRLSRKGMSLVRLSKLTGLSASAICHAESGRVEDISYDHISKVVQALKYKKSDWEDFLKGNKTRFDLEQECIKKIEVLDKERLHSIYLLLENFIN